MLPFYVCLCKLSLCLIFVLSHILTESWYIFTHILLGFFASSVGYTTGNYGRFPKFSSQISHKTIVIFTNFSCGLTQIESDAICCLHWLMKAKTSNLCHLLETWTLPLLTFMYICTKSHLVYDKYIHRLKTTMCLPHCGSSNKPADKGAGRSSWGDLLTRC